MPNSSLRSFLEFRGGWYFLNIFFSAILFIFLISYTVKDYQLLGVEDSGIFLNVIYNFARTFSFDSFVLDAFTKQFNFLSNHFSPFWIIFSPLSTVIDKPVELYYLIMSSGYIFLLTTFSYIYFKVFKKINFIKLFLFFSLTISFVSLFFEYSLNIHGVHETLFAMPFLSMAYYYFFIKQNNAKAILFYLPALFIKEDVVLVLSFLMLAIFIKTREIKYLLYSFLSLLLFFLIYIVIMQDIYFSGETVSNQGKYFEYLFNYNGVFNYLTKIYNHLSIRSFVTVVAFFLPFIFLIKFNKISQIDWVGFVLLSFVTIAMAILGGGKFANFIYAHYGNLIIPIVFIAILKYGRINFYTIVFYVVINISLIVLVIDVKQSWQYKYYVDEKKLYSDVMPKLDLEKDISIATDDRTGIYFANHHVQLLKFQKKNEHDYLIVNVRYLFFKENMVYSNRHNSVDKYSSSYNVIDKFLKKHNEMFVIYADYPFIVLGKNGISTFDSLKDDIKSWDKRTLEETPYIKSFLATLADRIM